MEPKKETTLEGPGEKKVPKPFLLAMCCLFDSLISESDPQHGR